MDEKKFQETEKKYKDLKEKHAGGEISTDQVKAELKRLMVQDEAGTYWMLGGKTGKWYRHDGGQWQEADPYVQVKAAEPEEPEEAEEEAPLELDASAKISEKEEEDYSYAAASLASDTESAGTEDAEIVFGTHDTGGAAGEDDSEIVFGTHDTGSAAGEDEPGISLGAYETNIRDTAGASEGAETIDITYPSFSTETYKSPVISSDEEERLYREVSRATEIVDTGEKDIYNTTEIEGAGAKDTYKATEIADVGANDTYDNYDAYSTFEIDTTSATGSETAAKTEAVDETDEAIKAEEAAEENLDSEKYEYTLHKGKPAVGPVGQVGQVGQAGLEDYEESGASLEPGLPTQQESPDSVTCGVCKSRIPPYAVYCAFCGAHQKTLKQRTTLKPVKEEGELLIKSIKISSLLFFLGGLGLIIGVILGATYGVMKEFLIDLSPQLPMMLNESRGGWSGGLIFAAVGGIGGFIFSAVLAVIVSCIYNLIAFIFGGIRFKVKR